MDQVLPLALRYKAAESLDAFVDVLESLLLNLSANSSFTEVCCANV